MKFNTGTRAAVAVLMAGALLVGGCGEGKNSKNNKGPEGSQAVLNVHASSTSTHQANFNPFASSVLMGAKGLIYEPLMIFTPMKPDEGEPSLAQKMEFNADGTQVTFTVRDGAKWSDGTPFTAKDVAYTFNLFVKEPATNTGALPMVSAEATDDKTAVVTFKQPVFARKSAIGNTTIVPEHIFGQQAKVMDFTNDKPVGTGPYTLKNFSEQVYSFTRNPDYWDADKIKVNEIAYPAATTQTFTTDLSQGKLDWSGGFVANVDQVFVARDTEHNKYWYPGDGQVNLLVNNTKAPMNDVKVRQAMSKALDREQISQIAEQGYAPPAHPTGMVLPAFEKNLDPEYADAKFERNLDEANQLLDAAGYPRGEGGVRSTPDGKKMSYDLVVPSGWTDTIAISKLVQEHLAPIGIEIKPSSVAQSNWVDLRKSGKFDLTIAPTTVGTAPYFYYRSFMSSEFKVPDDKPASSNPGRWYDPETDELFKQYESTDDPAKQQEALNGLQKIVVEELPLIPILRSPNWSQYRTKNFTGWPTEADPYALPAPYQYPDNLLVLKKLQPAK